MINLQHANCFDLLKTLPDDSIDMVLTDPPYGTTNLHFDKNIPKPADYMAELFRVLKPNGAMVIFCMQPFTTDVMTAGRKHYREHLIWDKVGVTGFLNAKSKHLRQHEEMLVFAKKMNIYTPQMMEGKAYTKLHRVPPPHYGRQTPSHITINTGYRYPTTIVAKTYADRRKESHSKHPSSKPVPLFEYLICTYSIQGDTVLDIFSGGGTTAIACLNTGRDFVGCELDQGYYEDSIKRIEANGTYTTANNEIDTPRGQLSFGF